VVISKNNFIEKIIKTAMGSYSNLANDEKIQAQSKKL